MKYVGIKKENTVYKIIESNDLKDMVGYELLGSRGEIRSHEYGITDILFAVKRNGNKIEYMIGNRKDISATVTQDSEYTVRSKATLWNPVLQIEKEILESRNSQD